MITAYILFYLLIISLYGYSALCFSFFYKNEINSKLKIQVGDILYGLFFLIIILLLINFIIAIKFVAYPIFIIGIILFIIFYKKKKLDLKNFYQTLFITFIIILLNSENSPTYDTQLYHHQLLNWNYNYKIPLNLIALDNRMGMISPWQLFLSVGNFKILDSYIALLFNFIPVFLLINHTLNSTNDKNKISYRFINISSIFILIFSLVHPFKNGIIMMHLGSLGTELPSMIFFVLTIYFFLKFLENESYKNYQHILILSILTVFCRISYLPILFLPIFILFKNKNFFYNFNLNLIVLSSTLLWLTRSLVNNGCLIFPVKFTCLSFNNYTSLEKIELYSNIVKSFARTAPDQKNFMDLDFSINTFQWFLPWLKNYFFTTSLIQISFVLTILLLIPFFFKTHKDIKKYAILLLVLLFTIILWLQAPDIRFGLGLFITIPIFMLSVILNISSSKLINNFKYLFIIIIFSLILKNLQNLELFFEKNIYIRNYNYENFQQFILDNNYIIVRNQNNNGFCYDIKYFCIINEKTDIFIEETKYGYLKFKIIN